MTGLVRSMLRRPLGERGGVALVMVLVFMVMAAPLTTAALKMMQTLSIASRVYDERLEAQYNAGAGLEAAIYEILRDPNFDVGLTTSSPDKVITASANNETVTVTVTKIFSSATVQGQGIVLSKVVSPTSTPASTFTTFTYTITIENEGSETVTLKEMVEYLPPHFTYDAGSTTGLTTSDPNATNSYGSEEGISPTCGVYPYRLTWSLSPSVQLAAGQQVTLTFQADGTLADGTYYNQVRAQYDPWWVSPDLYIYSPYTAEVTVGTGTPKCGFNMNVLVTKDVVPPNGVPGVETEFTYTINIENTSSGTRYVCQIDDLLPPGYTYVAGSSGDDPGNIATFEPPPSQQDGLWFDPSSQRWRIRWKIGTEDQAPPMATLAAGEVRTQVFRAKATVETGVDYFNEVNAVFASQLVGGECDIPDLVENGQGGTGQGGAGNSARVVTPRLYDITAVAADGTILSRIQFFDSTGKVDILSWQQY